jgi:hypothetical protein
MKKILFSLMSFVSISIYGQCIFSHEYIFIKKNDLDKILSIDSINHDSGIRDTLFSIMDKMIASLDGKPEIIPIEDSLKHLEFRNQTIKYENKFKPKKLKKFLKRQKFKLKIFKTLKKSKLNYLLLNITHYYSRIYPEKWYLHPEIHGYSDFFKMINKYSNTPLEQNKQIQNIFSYPLRIRNHIEIFSHPSKFVSITQLNADVISKYNLDLKNCEDAIHQFKNLETMMVEQGDYVIIRINWTQT